MRRKLKQRILISTVAISLLINTYLVLPAFSSFVPEARTVIFLLDNSGSMDKPYNGELKINTAKNSIRKALERYKSDSARLGLLELGGHCEVTERVAPDLNNHESIINALDEVQPRPYGDASTPIAEGVYRATEILKHEPGHHKIVLVSDGEANCSAQSEFPKSGCDMVADLRAKKIDFDLRLIGFGNDALLNDQAKCIAGLSDKVYSANTPEDLDNAIKDTMAPNGNSYSPNPFSQINEILKSFEQFCMNFQAAIAAFIALLVYLSGIFRKSDPDKFW